MTDFEIFTGIASFIVFAHHFYKLGTSIFGILWRRYREATFVPCAITIHSSHLFWPTYGPRLLRHIRFGLI